MPDPFHNESANQGRASNDERQREQDRAKHFHTPTIPHLRRSKQ